MRDLGDHIDMESPSGRVAVRVPARSRGRWRIAVKGEKAQTGRGFGALLDALDRTADRCDESDRLAIPAREIRVIAEDIREHRG